MITWVVLYPGEEPTGATFCADEPSLELCADALAAWHGFRDRDELIAAHPGLIVGWAPLH